MVVVCHPDDRWFEQSDHLTCAIAMMQWAAVNLVFHSPDVPQRCASLI
jgi:hypothetical protein